MTLIADINQLAADAVIVHSWVQGSSGTSVSMGGVMVRSPAKLIADQDAAINTAAGGILAQSTAQAVIATTKALEAAASAAAAAASAVNLRTINAQTGTAYTLALTDGSHTGVNPLLSLSNAAAVTVTVPSHATVPYPAGCQIDLIQDGVGKVTVSPAAGVTINSQAGYKSLSGQYVGASLVLKSIGVPGITPDVWNLVGGLIP
jgi:hypothetical protein